MDSSGSVSDMDYSTGMKFIQDVIEASDFDNGNVEAGLILYSSEIIVESEFTNDKKALIEIVKRNRKIFGMTSTGEAILKAAELFKAIENSSGVPKIMYLITDGWSNGMVNVEDAAPVIKKLGVTCYAVGVGYGFNEEELKAIASDGDYVYDTSSYDELLKKANQAQEQFCSTSAELSTNAESKPTVSPGSSHFSVG